MNKLIIYFLVLLMSGSAAALVPIEGIVLGDVKDVKQYDPLSEILSYEYVKGEQDKGQESKLFYYHALYKQGASLKNYCEKEPKFQYSELWREVSAKRSVAATLQYVGIHISLRAITAYAKQLEFSKEKFDLLAENLVHNTCSPNITVYSLKMIKNNFAQEWANGGDFKLPSVKNNPFFSKEIKDKHDTLITKKREMNMAIRNFRAFCSWNGDSDDYGMMVPYLKNQFIMSYVGNHLLKQKIALQKGTRELVLKYNEKGIQVACEDLICRRRNETKFNKIFPRMIGSTKLKDDFNALYCDFFRDVRYQHLNSNPTLKKWQKEQNLVEPKIEAMSFLSLITRVPEFLNVADNYQNIFEYLNKNIKKRWNAWADKKVNQLYFDQLYEEPLEIELISQLKKEKIKNGSFNILFDVGLSEIDKVLDGTDKITAEFDIKLPAKYIYYLKNRINFHYNRNEEEKVKLIEQKFVQRLTYILNMKQKYYKIPIWNDELAAIMADELLAQINIYKGNKFKTLKHKYIKVPVKFRYGIFALQYIQKKYKFKLNDQKVLTFK